MNGQEKVLTVSIIAGFLFLISLVAGSSFENITAIKAGLVQDSVQGKTMWVKPKEGK